MFTKDQLGADGADEQQFINYLNDRIATDRFIDRENTRRADREDVATEIHCKCCGAFITRWPTNKIYDGRDYCRNKSCQHERIKRNKWSRQSKTENRNWLDKFWADCQAAGCDFGAYSYSPPAAPWGLFPGVKFKRALSGSYYRDAYSWRRADKFGDDFSIRKQMLADKVLVSFGERAEKEELKTEEVVIGGQKEVVIARPLEYIATGGEIKQIDRKEPTCRILLPPRKRSKREDEQLREYAGQTRDRRREPLAPKMDRARARFRRAVLIVEDAEWDMRWQNELHRKDLEAKLPGNVCAAVREYFGRPRPTQEYPEYPARLRWHFDKFLRFVFGSEANARYVGECFEHLKAVADHLKRGEDNIGDRLRDAHTVAEQVLIAAHWVIESADYTRPRRMFKQDGVYKVPAGPEESERTSRERRDADKLYVPPRIDARMIDESRVVAAVARTSNNLENFWEIGEQLHLEALKALGGKKKFKIEHHFNIHRSTMNRRRNDGLRHIGFWCEPLPKKRAKRAA